MERGPHGNAVFENSDATKEQSLSENRYRNRDVHRISHVTKRTAHYEVARREDGSGCAKALQGEACKAIGEHGEARDDQE